MKTLERHEIETNARILYYVVVGFKGKVGVELSDLMWMEDWLNCSSFEPDELKNGLYRLLKSGLICLKNGRLFRESKMEEFRIKSVHKKAGNWKKIEVIDKYLNQLYPLVLNGMINSKLRETCYEYIDDNFELAQKQYHIEFKKIYGAKQKSKKDHV